jgi:hypothetical protein
MPNPPLIFLCAAAALCASIIQQTAVPLLKASEYRSSVDPLNAAGNFSANLAAISGIIALGFALLGFARHATWMGIVRRFVLAGFSGVFLASMGIAVLFDRQRTTTESVLFAFGAASVLASLLHGIAFRAARGFSEHVLAASASLMAAAALLAQLLQLWSEHNLSASHLSALYVARSAGEIAYLVILVSAALVVLPERDQPLGRVARVVGLALVPLAIGGLIAAESALGKDYGIVLYQSQRVSFWIDTMPRAYVLPLALGLAGSFAGLLGGTSAQREGACGLLLLLCSGYAPPAPGRLLTLTLGLTLLARAIVWMRGSTARASTPAPRTSSAPT